MIAGGLAVAAGGAAIATAWDTGAPVWVFLLGISLLGLGVGLTAAPGTELIVAAVPRSMAGVGSAINDTTRELGGTLGVAVLGSVAVSVYRADLGGAGPASLPAATGLEPGLAAARAAFVDGLGTVAAVAAAALAVTAAAVAVHGRTSPRPGGPTDLPTDRERAEDR